MSSKHIVVSVYPKGVLDGQLNLLRLCILMESQSKLWKEKLKIQSCEIIIQLNITSNLYAILAS